VKFSIVVVIVLCSTLNCARTYRETILIDVRDGESITHWKENGVRILAQDTIYTITGKKIRVEYR
jgi:hypothetical protein